MNLASVHREIRSCSKCEKLCPWRKFKDEDYGNLKSKIMLIGEAPGTKAIENNLTWSGTAGKRLRKIVSPFGRLEDVFYMTNVLKCLPPGNRDPTKREIENCSSYLKREMSIVRPKVVLTVGRFATDLVFDMLGIEKKSIVDLHLQRIKTDGFEIIPILHPSYANVWTSTYDQDVTRLLAGILDKYEGCAR